MGIYVTHIRELALNGNVKFKLAAAGTEEMGIEPEKIESSGLPDGSIVSAAAMVDPLHQGHRIRQCRQCHRHHSELHRV